MQKDEQLPQLVALLAAITDTNAKDIASDTVLVRDLQLDSILRIELVTRIEDVFGVTVPEVNITAKTSVTDLLALINVANPVEKRLKIKEWPLSLFARIIRYVGQSFFFFPLMRLVTKLEVADQDNFKDVKYPVIIMSNHISLFDGIFLSAALNIKVRNRLAYAAAKDSIFGEFRKYLPAIQLFFNAFPFPRKENEDIKSGFNYTGALLDRGWSVALFPEGRVSHSDTMNEFKRGAGLMASLMNVPIIPVRIKGTAFIYGSKKSIFSKRHSVSIKFGKPLYFVDKSESYEDATRRIEHAIREL